jgi:hypothetical protein
MLCAPDACENNPMPTSGKNLFIRAAGVAAIVGGSLNLYSLLVHPRGLLRAAVPTSVFCLLIGVVGLHTLLWKREGTLGLMGFVLVGIGLLLGFIGMAGSALGILNPNPWAVIINTGEHAGLVFIGAGMCLWGILTLRLKALGNLSVMPLLIGILALPGIVFLSPEAFSALENGVLPKIFAVSWALFGYSLLIGQKLPKGSLAQS